VILFIAGMWLMAVGARAQGEEAAPRPTPPAVVGHGQLRVVHAWAGVPAVDVEVDGRPLRAGLAFGADTAYVPFPEGMHAVAVVAGQAPLLSAEVALAAGEARTLVASGGPWGALVLDDVALAPVGGPALVRFVHAADGLPALELVGAGGARLAGPVAPGTASSYVDVTPDAFTLSAREAASGATVAAIPGAVVVADRSYTFVAIGAAGRPLSLLGLVDD
jgi:hypothetical protein